MDADGYLHTLLHLSSLVLCYGTGSHSGECVACAIGAIRFAAVCGCQGIRDWLLSRYGIYVSCGPYLVSIGMVLWKLWQSMAIVVQEHPESLSSAKKKRP